MNIRINSKVMKDALNALLLKGKWNVGQSAKNSQLNNAVLLEVGETAHLFNADEATFIKFELDCEIISHGRVCLNTDIMNKYLVGSEVIGISHNEQTQVLEITAPTRLITIPIMERHSSSDSINYCKENYTVSYTDYPFTEGVNISPKTILKSVFVIDSEVMCSALKSCEIVGSAIYKLDYDGEGGLCVSSAKDSEVIEIEIELEEYSGPPAIVEFTAPVHKLLSGEIVIAFNDDSPICFINRRVKILRAPRVGE